MNQGIDNARGRCTVKTTTSKELEMNELGASRKARTRSRFITCHEQHFHLQNVVRDGLSHATKVLT